jgi:hypothetical protein
MSDDCIICGKWPEKDRWALREMLDTLPLQGADLRRLLNGLLAKLGVARRRRRDGALTALPSAYPRTSEIAPKRTFS